MSKDRLLSDEELKEKIDTILENEFYKGFETANEGFGGRDSYNLNKIINLINTQKRFYAEMVVGLDDTKPSGLIANSTARNQLRAEQRAKLTNTKED